MAIRAVVFDLFDTLVDMLSESIPMTRVGDRDVPCFIADLHALLVDESGVTFSRFLEAMASVERAFRRSHYAKGLELPTTVRFAELVERLEIDSPGLHERMTEAHMSRLIAQVRYLDHHREVLAALAGDVRIALCSNFSHSPTAMEVLARADLLEFFDVKVVSDAYGFRKPRKEIFHAVFEALDLAPEDVLHVGDSLDADVAGASSVGARTAWSTRRVSDQSGALAAYAGPEPDHCIADLGELPALVRSLRASA